MTEEENPKGRTLEQILYKLLDYQSDQKNDNIDTMLILSLVNLLGIVSFINKKPVAAGVQGSGSLGPLMGMLLNMLSGQQLENKEGGTGQDKSGFNPAALLSLLNMFTQSSGGKTPDLSALMNLLGSFLGSAGKSPAKPEAQERAESKGGIPASVYSNKIREVKKAGGAARWDSRLGDATG
jgi:hypothetical protein